jgi:hypothetical protein
MMETTFGIPEVALQLPHADLQRLEDRTRDEKFCFELVEHFRLRTRMPPEGKTAAPSVVF